MRPPLVVLLAVAATFAGCFTPEPVPDERRFTASGGAVSAGWAYDGVGLAPGSATLDGVLQNGANTGSVNVTFEHAGSTWVVSFDTFAQAAGREFMDGGVAYELIEHGDTGVADASIPRILAKVAAWGSARVTRDGALAAPEPWSAHLMLSGDTVRGSDGKIAKTDGATPYDPASPGDARRVEGDPQGIFWIKHPQGETFSRGAVPVDATLACSPPQCTQTAEIPLDQGAKTLALNVTIAASAPLPLAAGRGALTFTDANGTEVLPAMTFQVTPSPAPTVVPLEADLAGLQGPITITLTGEGAYSVRAEGSVSYDDIPFLVVTWDDFTLA